MCGRTTEPVHEDEGVRERRDLLGAVRAGRAARAGAGGRVRRAVLRVSPLQHHAPRAPRQVQARE